MSKHGRVWIVEDDESVRTALVGLLQSLGWPAEGYRSAEEFLAQADRTQSGCLVTDIKLPGLGGIALAEQLRAGREAVPVIMITARTEDSLEERARAADAVCLLKKPFPAEALIACLERALATGDG